MMFGPRSSRNPAQTATFDQQLVWRIHGNDGSASIRLGTISPTRGRRVISYGMAGFPRLDSSSSATAANYRRDPRGGRCPNRDGLAVLVLLHHVIVLDLGLPLNSHSPGLFDFRHALDEYKFRSPHLISPPSRWRMSSAIPGMAR